MITPRDRLKLYMLNSISWPSFLKVLIIAIVIFCGKEVWEELAYLLGWDIRYCTCINSKSLVEMKWYNVHLFGFFDIKIIILSGISILK